MLHKTRGIVFHTTDYSETSIIAKIYTELFGVQSYMVNGVRKQNARNRSSIFQPLSLVEMVVYHKERGGIQRISEIRNTPQYKNIPFDVVKTSMVLFLCEVIYRAVKEEEENSDLFEYLFNGLQVLDVQPETTGNFHLSFLLRLTRFLGFFPNGAYSEDAPFFNLQDGTFEALTPSHPFFLDKILSRKFNEVIIASANLSETVLLSAAERRELIERLLEYFRLHIDGFGEVKSHKVLEQVWM
jgi:DNA repair protein RecO (recombination protein O)